MPPSPSHSVRYIGEKRSPIDTKQVQRGIRLLWDAAWAPPAKLCLRVTWERRSSLPRLGLLLLSLRGRSVPSPAHRRASGGRYPGRVAVCGSGLWPLARGVFLSRLFLLRRFEGAALREPGACAGGAISFPSLKNKPRSMISAVRKPG